MKYNEICKNGNVWGSKPNELLQRIYNQVNAGSEFLDLGCGQGKDALFMLQKGFKITAVDNSPEGIKKIKESIQINNFPPSNIDLFCEDIKNFDVKQEKYTIINAWNSLQFLSKQNALQLIDKIKKTIKGNGYVIISSFTTHDPLAKKIHNRNRCFFKSHELRNLFSDFNIVFYEEGTIADKGHSGSPEPHTHDIVKMIAQKK